MDEQHFTVAPDAFDVALLPPEARTPRTPAFREAVQAFLQCAFQAFGGRATLLVDDTRIAVSWQSGAAGTRPLDVIAAKLRRGERKEAIQLLRLLLSRAPDDLETLYELGTALSDAGQLPEAEEVLRRVVSLAPDFANGLIALGVALSRQQMNDEASGVLRAAIRLAPNNHWAHRNLGVTLLKLSLSEEAVTHLKEALRLEPQDQPTWLVLGEALQQAGRHPEAERAYRKAIDLNPHNDVAEEARRASNALAQADFRGDNASRARPEAVQHCLAALQTVAKLPKAQVQKIAFEIAALGRSGLNVHSPRKQYRLESMPGEFSGLELVAFMYVAFRQISPKTDVGFDLSREYQVARKLFAQGTEGE